MIQLKYPLNHLNNYNKPRINLKITVCGGGSVAKLFAADLSMAGHKVN
jgi:hypothetical protein